MIITLAVIFLIILPLLGLSFFFHSLILKKNRGCGVAGLLTLIPLILVILFLMYGVNYQTKGEFIRDFEQHTQVSFPPSGKIVEKVFSEGYLDSACAGIIEMDTLDYEKILNEFRSSIENNSPAYREPAKKQSSSMLKTCFPASECAFADFSLWFHINRRIIVYESIRD